MNRIEYQEGMTKDLTAFQNYFHEKITPLTDRWAKLHNKLKWGKTPFKTNKQLEKLELELAQFKIDETSDDAKELELAQIPPQITMGD